MDYSNFDPVAFKEAYERDGYAIVRGVFSVAEVAEMKSRFDVWRSEMLTKHHATFVSGNHRVWVSEGGVGGVGSLKRVIRGVQWPSYSDPMLDSYRTDSRMFNITSALIGPDVKQIINQMHWKMPGSTTSWRHHQDVRARKPDDAFRQLWSSYINTGIALERFDDETGAMSVMPKSHGSKTDLGLEQIAEEMGLDNHSPTREEERDFMKRAGFNFDDFRTLVLAPGDVGVWHPFAIHGGGINTSSDCFRSFYINGYVKAQNCDRGHVVWTDGVKQPLGEQVLIQLDNYKETLAEGGRYYATAANGGGSKLDQEIQREALAKAMNVVRD
jgi:ectoine hydroxylase-related dioxygenase (phytanoyl-CoA dioxygenase family)